MTRRFNIDSTTFDKVFVLHFHLFSSFHLLVVHCYRQTWTDFVADILGSNDSDRFPCCYDSVTIYWYGTSHQ